MTTTSFTEHIYRVVSCTTCTSRHGQPYLKFKLGNLNELVTGYGWNRTYAGPDVFDIGEPVRVSGRKRLFNGNVVADISAIEIFDAHPSDSIHLLPINLFNDSSQVLALETITGSIAHKTLRDFALLTFLDFIFSRSFLQAPASLNYHHAYPGGLLDHSLECAQIILSIPCISKVQRDLAICAALFHDAGKVLTLSDNMERKNLGYLVDHDSLTLEALYRPLHWLDQKWPDAGLALRHIWTCKNIRRWGYSPKMAVAHLVHLADRVSSEMDKELRSFEKLEDWRQVSKPMDKHRYWRLLPDDAELAEIDIREHHG